MKFDTLKQNEILTTFNTLGYPEIYLCIMIHYGNMNYL
jgi:hypothetical protein